MKLFGHPLHIMLIHFPSALFPMDLICSALFLYTGDAAFTTAAFYAVVGGVVLGWLAIAMGAMDLINVSERHPDALKKALIHGLLNTAIVIVYTVWFYSGYKVYPALVPGSLSAVVLKAFLVLTLAVGNFLGGSLILKHKVAIENK
jgi:uncharacterized membrane protein